MQYTVTADTDIGIAKDTNQDSLCVKIADTPIGKVLMAIICDGMGGLSKGELASATVIREFSGWFNDELSQELNTVNMDVIGGKWELMLKDLNSRILEYGKGVQANLGTTFTGILFISDEYLIVHVGDTRAYYISSEIKQLTEDQTVVAREIKRGTMTLEEAKTDSRRNMLLQCIGASKVISPQIIRGTIMRGMYMLCSDGFRHEISEDEILESLNPRNLLSNEAMHTNSLHLINLVKSRNERDNISVVLIKVD